LTKTRGRIQSAETIVVKVGTSTITYPNGKMNLMFAERLVRVLSNLKNQGKNIVLVTSGAIGVGRAKMGLLQRPDSIPEKQALASIGQVNLMYIYSKLFGEYGQVASQVLLTKDVLDGGEREQNAINTFQTLFQYNSIPIVNENDTISIEQIQFGDNDTLSAIVSVLVKADLLILLSDIDGLYTKDPNEDKDAELIHVVYGVTEEIINASGNTHSDLGTGGMRTKIAAAQICLDHDIPMVIANGDNPSNINRILAGEDVGTLFVPCNEGGYV
jgi:glutamate 5-kinase